MGLKRHPTAPWNGEKSMGNRIEVGNLKIDEGLYTLIRDEIAPDTGVEADAFWKALGDIACGVRTRKQGTLGETGYTPTTD